MLKEIFYDSNFQNSQGFCFENFLRSWLEKPRQLALSYDLIENFTKDLGPLRISLRASSPFGGYREK